MDLEVYYFSGTGNSLAVAREIARATGASLIPMQRAMRRERIAAGAKNLGIVFPSYFAAASGVPLMVERFVKKIISPGGLRMFSVCTCGGYESVNALPSLRALDRIVRSCGGRVSAAYSVRLPMNNLDYDHIPIPIERDTEVIIQRSRKKIAQICDRILKGRRTRHRVFKAAFLFLMEPLFRLIRKSAVDALRERAKEPAGSGLGYADLVPLTDRSIAVDDGCAGCGTCAKVCPAKNIRIVDRKPSFLHRCEMCFACDEWCPSGAIHHWARKNGAKYRHPDVKLTDMLTGD